MSQHKHKWEWDNDLGVSYIKCFGCGYTLIPEDMTDETIKVNELEDKLVKIRDYIDQIDEYNHPSVNEMCFMIDCLLRGSPI